MSSSERRRTRLKSWSSVSTTVRSASHASGERRGTVSRGRGVPRRGVVLVQAVAEPDRLRATRLQREREPQLVRGLARLGGAVGGHGERAVEPVAAPLGEADAVRAPLDGDRLALAGRQDAADRQHRLEVGGEQQVDVEVERLAVVGVDEQRLLDLVVGDDPPLEPQLEALQRQHPAAGERQGRVGQLVHGLGPGRGGGDQQPRPDAVHAQLVAGEEAAVVAVEPERVRRPDGEGAVAPAHHEDVPLLDDLGLGEVDERARGRLGVLRRVAGAGGGCVGFEVHSCGGCPFLRDACGDRCAG